MKYTKCYKKLRLRAIIKFFKKRRQTSMIELKQQWSVLNVLSMIVIDADKQKKTKRPFLMLLVSSHLVGRK